MLGQLRRKNRKKEIDLVRARDRYLEFPEEVLVEVAGTDEYQLIVRLDLPSDNSTRQKGKIALKGWFLAPTPIDISDSAETVTKLPTIEVFFEQQLLVESQHRKGMIASARRLGTNYSRTGAYLSEFQIKPAKTRPNKDRRPDQRQRQFVFVEAVIDLTALAPKESEDSVLCSVFLVATLGLRKSISNINTFALESSSVCPQSIGGFTSICSSEVNSNCWLLRGWAVNGGESLQRVTIKIAQREVGQAVCGIDGLTQRLALPDLISPDGSCFELILNRSQVLSAGITEQQLVQGVLVEADCQFPSGVRLKFDSPIVRWLPDPWPARGLAVPVGRIESVYLNQQGEVSVEGWVVVTGAAMPELSLRWRKFYLPLSGTESSAVNLQWSDSPEFDWRFPTAGLAGAQCFSFSVSPQVFGELPGVVDLLARDPVSGLITELGPRSMGIAIADVAEQQNSRSTANKFFPNKLILRGIRTAETAGFFLRNLLRAKSLGSLEQSKRSPKSKSPSLRKLKTRPRILFCSHNLSAVEGAPKVLFEVIKFLLPESEPLVVAARGGALERELSQLGVQTVVIPELDLIDQTWQRYKLGQASLLQLLMAQQPDLIYANVIDSFWAIEAGARFAVPCIWSIHESKPPQQVFSDIDPRLKERFLFALNRVDQKIFVAEATKQLFNNFSTARNSIYIANGVDLAKISEEKRRLSRSTARKLLSVSLDELVISIIGTTTARKGQDVFIREMAEVKRNLGRQKGRKFRFFLVGAREIEFLDGLRELSKSLGLESEIVFVPEQPEIARYYIASDAIVIASKEESAPLVSLEAFAYGVPLITTDVFGLAEQVVDCKNALVFQRDVFGSLASAVVRLDSESELGPKLVAGGINTVHSRFNLADSLQQYRREILTILAKNPGYAERRMNC